MPVSEYRYRRRVQFADTDLAGVVHFSWIVRYMEEAEHALWREAGLTIAPVGDVLGYPRVSVAVDFKAPLKFEDEFDDLVRITAINRTSISYAHTITRGDTLVATGTMTAVCVTKKDGQLVAMELPENVRTRLAQSV